MLDAFSRKAVSADSSGSFIGAGDLADLKSFIADGNKASTLLTPLLNASRVVSDSIAGICCENTARPLPTVLTPTADGRLPA